MFLLCFYGYTLYGMYLFRAFLLLLMVTSVVTVSLVVLQGNDVCSWETYINGGILGFFVYAYFSILTSRKAKCKV
jgi:hypothetical protein